MLDEIRDLYDYNRWANRRTLDATARLDAERFARDLGSSFSSVRETLVHILAAEWIWLERWNGRSPADTPAGWAIESHADVRREWDAVDADRAAFLARLTPAALTAEIAYRDTRGNAYRAPLAQLMRHVVNHSSYHRGQIATMLRQLGAEPAATDLVLYHRELAGLDQPA